MWKSHQYTLQPVILFCLIFTSNVPLNATRCSGTKLDLVFLLDLTLAATVDCVNLIKDLLLYADVDGGKVRVGVVVYTRITYVKFHLNQHFKKEEIYRVLPSFYSDNKVYLMHRDYPGNNIADALKTMRSDMFTKENGDREGVNNVAVLLTLGESDFNSNRTIPEAELAKSEGIHIYVIGFNSIFRTNKNVSDELDEIASIPAAVNRFHAINLEIKDDFKQDIIRALYKKCDLYNEDLPCDSECLLPCNESCPTQGYDNLAEKCNLTENGQVDNTGCVSTEVSNLVNNIKNVSKEDFTRAINKVSDVIMKLLKSKSTSQDDVTDKIIETLQAVGEKVSDPNFKVDEATFETLVSLSDIVTSSQQTIWRYVKEEEGPATISISSLISSLEDIAFKGLSENTKNKSIHLVKNTLGVEIGNVLEDIQYPKPRIPQFSSSVADPWINKNEIFLSHYAFDSFDAINSSIKYSIVVIHNQHNAGKNDSLTKTFNEPRGQVIVSDILALSVNVNLTTPLNSSVRLTFGGLQLRTIDRKPVCAFLNTSSGGLKTWSSEGCDMENITDYHIICTCNHLTTFAVLASPFEQLHHNVLSSLSIAGCTVSSVCLTVTVFVYLYLWKYIRSERAVLLVDLSVCMLIAYLIFVVGIDKTEDKIACKVVAICLHYCFLSVFCNFLSQSLALYTSLHSMTDKPHRKLYLLLTHFCPLIIVSITLAVYKTEGYGTDKYCWLSHERGLIWSFLGPIVGIIFVNGLVLLVVIRIAQRTRAMEGQASTVKIFSVVRAIVILTPLFGLTWFFGFLSINDDYVVFQYLFVILNSFQGLFIFVIHCLAHRQVREAFQNVLRKKTSGHLDSGYKMTSSLPNLTSN